LESGHTPSRRRPEYWDGNIPWISLHDSHALDVPEIFQTAKTISELGLENSSARLLPKGTVVFSRTATVGKATVMGREMTTSQDFANYVCGDRVVGQYLMHLFRYMEPEWNRLMAGSTHNTIYMPVFRDLQVMLPPRKEQEAIATALSDVDTLISSLDQLIAKKRDIKQATMQQLLTGKQRLPGFVAERKGEQPYKRTEVGQIPADWAVMKLRDLATFRTGPFGSALHKSDYTINGVPVINPMHIADGQIQPTDTMSVTESAAEQLSEFRLKRGEIIMGRRGDMGRCAVVKDAHVGWLCGTGSMIVRCGKLVHSEFLQRVLSSAAVVAAIEAASVGSTMINLNQSTLGELKIQTPSLEEQTAIASVLSNIDAEIAVLEQKRDKIRALKQGMMQELLTGRIRLV
jgi:type I restriction enzyme S subunit